MTLLPWLVFWITIVALGVWMVAQATMHVRDREQDAWLEAFTYLQVNPHDLAGALTRAVAVAPWLRSLRAAQRALEAVKPLER